MNFQDYIAKNWAQISFILIALGYLIKGILENLLKKKEIRYTFFLTNRAQSIELFLGDYNKLEKAFIRSCGSYFAKELSTTEIYDLLTPLKDNLHNSFSKLQLYTTEKEFKNFAQINNILQDLITRSWYEPIIKNLDLVKHAEIARNNIEEYHIYNLKYFRETFKSFKI